MRVFGEHWRLPARMPAMLDLSRDASPLSRAFTRLGFEVTALRLRDDALTDLAERLEQLTGRFDLICCHDVLEHVDDWRRVIVGLARRLRPGALFLYSVDYTVDGVGALGGRAMRWLRAVRRRLPGAGFVPLRSDRTVTAGELTAGLRAARLLTRESVTLGGRRGLAVVATAPAGATSFAGFAVREADRLAVAPMRWDFSGTGERWLAGRLAGASLVGRIGAS
jgi:SAM-dependent methyltransferase